MEMIKLTDVAKQFDGIAALKNISLEVVKGEIFSVIGPNGSGKTTLLRIMAGIDTPTRGTVFFDGEEMNRKNLVKLRRRGTMVFQKTALFNTTVFGNIAYGLKLRQFSQQEIKKRLDKYPCRYIEHRFRKFHCNHMRDSTVYQ